MAVAVAAGLCVMTLRIGMLGTHLFGALPGNIGLYAVLGFSAATGAHVLYTDVWASMGQEAEAEERALVFHPFQLNQNLIDAADPGVLVMHCLPAHRGEEIADVAIDGEHAVVFDQAENRLHTQKALLVFLFDIA